MGLKASTLGRGIVILFVAAPIVAILYGGWTVWSRYSAYKQRKESAVQELLGARFYGTTLTDTMQYGGAYVSETAVSFDRDLPLVYIGERGMFPFELGNDLRTVYVGVPSDFARTMQFELKLSENRQELTYKASHTGDEFMLVSGTLTRQDHSPWLHKVQPIMKTLGL